MFIRFEKGMTAWVIPIRYWEDEYEIYPVTVEESMSMDSRDVYARDERESQAMYYTVKDRVFYKKENAEKARKLRCELRDLENSDGTEVLMTIIDREHHEQEERQVEEL